MNKCKRFLALLLVLCMMLSVVPFSAFAAEVSDETTDGESRNTTVETIAEESTAEKTTGETTVEETTVEETTVEETTVEATTAEETTVEETTEKSTVEEATEETTVEETTEETTAEEDMMLVQGIASFALTREAAGYALSISTKPADGTTTGNPFVRGTGGSNSFRIPAMVTLNDGTIVAAADARWNTTYDGGGLDTIASYSTDNGANWNYTFANYLGDNGNVYNGSGSTAFIDPALATDGSTVYMLCDLYPYGVALNGSGNNAPSTAVGFNGDGKLLLSSDGANYNYYLDGTVIKDSNGNEISDYTVDAYFNIKSTDGTTDTNLFFSDSPYQVVRTGYLYLTSSSDGGKTWSAPTLIPNVKTASEQVCLVGPGRGLVTGGKIIFPVYSYNGSSSSQQMGFIYSSDSGKTWSRSANFTGDSWSSESAVVALSDGTLRFFYRNGNSRLCYADYTWGTGWGSAVNTGISTNSNTQISAISYSKTVDGKQVILVSCPTGSNNAGSADSSASARLNGKIFVGLVNSDNTMSWQDSAKISVPSVNSSNQFMYSCLTELNDGKIAILYEDCESAWGNGYYTMSFATYNLSLTTDSGEENNEPTTVTDETTDISVTAKGLSSVTAIEQPSSTPYAGYTNSVTYSITLNNGEYTDSAEIKIPYDNAFDGCTDFIGTVANNDDTVDTFSVELVDNYFVGAVPHFSDVTISGRAVTGEVTVTLNIGDTSETITDNTGNYTNNYTAPDATIATINVVGTDGQEGGETHTAASVTCDTLISKNSSSWTAVSKYYYKADDGNYYPLYAKRSSSGYIIKRYTYTWGYSTANSTSNVTQIGTQSTTDTSTTPNITVYTKSTAEAIPASTTITFTGVSAGTTTAVVGSTQYNITVSRNTKNVNLFVGGSATYDDASTGTPVVGNSKVASATLSDGKLTITGVAEGTTTVKTDTTVYNVTVKEIPPIVDMETTPFTSGTGNAQGSKVTKLTTSVKMSYDLNLSVSGSNISWSSADESIATVDQNGTITGVAAGETTVTCTVDGVSYTIPVVVLYNETYLADNTYTYTCDLYITEITSTTVKYSINLDTALLDAQEGEAIYMGFDYPFCIDFFGMQNTGYALSYMAATDTAGNYYPLYEVEDVTTLDVYNDGAMKWQRLEMTDGANRVQALLRSVIDAGFNGATGFTRTKNNKDLTSKLSFRSEKLPTVEKEVAGVLGKSGLTSDYREYTEGMTAVEGETVFFKITVTKYASQDQIDYSDAVLTDNLSGAAFYESTGADGKPVTSGNTKDITSSITDSGLAAGTYTYYVLYTIQDSDLDTTIRNTVDFSYKYSSTYSSGTFGGQATADAKITATSFEAQDIVIDFGLPVTVHYAPWGTSSTVLESEGMAAYGSVAVTGDHVNGWDVTYTPKEILRGVDTVTLYSTNNAEYTFKVYPATTVYYEEGFATYSDGWSTGSKGTGNQATQIAGNSSDEYGRDGAYANGVGASNGTQATSVAKGDTCTFTFTGTGFEVYANCDEGTGYLSSVVIQNESGATVKVYMVNTVAADGISGATTGQRTTLYSLPIISEQSLDYDTYKVTITHIKNTDPIHIDGFRVYGTLKTEPGFYTTDEEDDPMFIELRDRVLASLKATSANSEKYADQIAKNLYSQVYATANGNTNGAIVISANASYENSDLTDLLDNGPKNEIFLWNNQALTFKVKTSREVQIGLKAADQATSYVVTIGDNKGETKTISTSTDMFYTMLGKGQGDASDGTIITIKNTGSGILSITKLKVCDDPNATLGSLTEEDLIPAMLSLGYELDPNGSGTTDPTNPTEPVVPPVDPEEPEVTYADATLSVFLVDYSGKQVASVNLTDNGVAGETKAFTAEEVLAAAKANVPEGYVLVDESKVTGAEVAYGESGKVTVQIDKTATLKVIYVNLRGKNVGTATITKVQTSAGSCQFSASEIRAKAPAGRRAVWLTSVKVPYGSDRTIIVPVF